MRNVMISIVVPIYNVEQYLEKCICSLINQTYKNVEILLINDGSPDNSLEICERYAKEYNNIKVYSKENGGLSDARNYGLMRANGEYVLFVDSDDYIKEDGIEKFVNCINEMSMQLDIVIGQFEVIDGNEIHEQSVKRYFLKATSGQKFIKEKLVNREFPVQVWTKLYRKDFLIDNKLFFEKNLLHEDELFTPLVFLQAENVIEIENAFYRYVKRAGSIMTSKNQIKNVKSIKKLITILISELIGLEDSELKKMLFDHLVTIYYQGLARIPKKDAEKEKLIDYKFLKLYSKTTKNKIRYFIVRFLYTQLPRFV